MNYKESEGKKKKLPRDVNYKWHKKNAMASTKRLKRHVYNLHPLSNTPPLPQSLH